MQFLDTKLYKFLSHPWIGRPLRKINWLLLKALKISLRKFEYLFNNMPFVIEVSKASDAPHKIEPFRRYVLQLRDRCRDLPFKPKISVLVPLYKVQDSYFRDMLESVALQGYENWELCIVDDCSNQESLKKIVEKFSARFPEKVKFSQHPTNRHISITSNSCLELATGEYIALLDHDDLLLPNALGEVVRFINLNKEPDILYSDERVIDSEGRRKNIPFHKPDWSPFMHLVKNYTTHLTAYKTDLIRSIGGFRAGFEGSQDHDLMLRATEVTLKPIVHIPFILYQWRAHINSTASGSAAKPYAAIAGEKAVAEACIRRGRPAKVTYETFTGQYRIQFQLPSSLPLVSIIIPSKDSFQFVKNCINSIFDKSTFLNFEIILVDNGTTDSSCLQFFDATLEKHGASKFKVIRADIPFNYARLNRIGVEAASGSFLLFLNNDTEVMTPDWIEELYSYAQFPEVGAVGAKLLYPDGLVQHAGVALTGKDVACSIGVLRKSDDQLYANAMLTTHEISAVSAACLLIRKSYYLDVGGFEDVFIPNGYGDVDFCLKLRGKGFLNIFTPYALLTHHESKTRKKNIEGFEKFYMTQKWSDSLISDPYLNFNMDYTGYYDLRKSYFEMDINWREYWERCQFHLKESR